MSIEASGMDGRQGDSETEGAEVLPIRAPNRQIGPLGLGLLSLVFDPLLVPTWMAISRGFEDIRRLSFRELGGLSSPEHDKVRTEAVVGMLLALVKPMLIALVLVFVVCGETDEPRVAAHPGFHHDEFTEIFERLSSPDDEERLTAVEHLRIVAPGLTRSQRARLWDAVRREYPAWEAGDGPNIRAEALWAIFDQPYPGDIQRARLFYPSLPASLRSVVLTGLAGSDRDDAIDALLDLARDDPGPSADELPPRFPIRELAARPQLAPVLIPELIALPEGNPFVTGGRELALDYCLQGAALWDSFNGTSERLLAEWRVINDELQRPSPPEGTEGARLELRADALQVLDLLGCVRGPGVDRALAEATRLDDLWLVVYAIRAQLRRGEAADPAAIERVAASVATRAFLYQELERRGQLSRFPSQYARGEQLALSHMVSWLANSLELSRPPDEIQRMELLSDERGLYHVFRFRIEGDGRGWMAGLAGPYPDADTPVGPMPDRTYSTFEPWSAGAGLNILTAIRRWEEED